MFQKNKISSDTLLTIPTDILLYPELLFIFKLPNSFSNSKSVKLMVLRQGPL